MLSRLFIAALWSPAGRGETSWISVVIFNCVFVTFSCGILGWVRYLIVSIPDLCRLSYFHIQTMFWMHRRNILSLVFHIQTMFWVLSRRIYFWYFISKLCYGCLEETFIVVYHTQTMFCVLRLREFISKLQEVFHDYLNKEFLAMRRTISLNKTFVLVC